MIRLLWRIRHCLHEYCTGQSGGLLEQKQCELTLSFPQGRGQLVYEAEVVVRQNKPHHHISFQ